MASRNVVQRKKTKKTKVDRISSLTDEILSNILSLLPTKCAVETSILSKRWKYIWTSITSFDFKFPTDNYHQVSGSQWDDENRVKAWIREAFNCNVREVNISMHSLPFGIFSCKTVSVMTIANIKKFDSIVSFDLPCLKVLHVSHGYYNNGFLEKLICGCPSLEELTLAGTHTNNTITGSFDMPCLKVLHIKNGFLDKGLLEKLISSCPVLEDLTLCKHIQDESFTISSPSLRTLRSRITNYTSYGAPATLSIKAPKLEYLHLDKDFKELSIIGDFHRLLRHM